MKLRHVHLALLLYNGRRDLVMMVVRFSPGFTTLNEETVKKGIFERLNS